jgi:hypothetical protein
MSVVHLKKAYDSVREEVLHSVPIVFWEPMKLARLTKISLN